MIAPPTSYRVRTPGDGAQWEVSDVAEEDQEYEKVGGYDEVDPLP